MEVDQRWLDAMRPLHTRYPHRDLYPQTNTLASPSTAHNSCPTPRIHTHAPYNIPSVVTQLTLDNQPITLFATHPLPPTSKQNHATRDAQLQHIAQLLQSTNHPLLVLGDLNTSMWSPAYNNLTDSLQLNNARQGFGILPTWPAKLGPAGIPIDHCLVSPHFVVTDCRVGPNIGSDHKPLIVTLQIRNNAPAITSN